MPLLLSQCLFAYIATHFFSVPSFSFLMNPLHPLFFTNLLSPHKTLPLPPSQFHLRKQSWFFFLGSKTLAEHYIVTMQWLLLSSSFIYLFFQKKFHRSSHCRIEIFAWNYPEHWCEFNVWQNVMVEASTMVIKIALTWTARTAHGSQNRAVGPQFVRVPAFFAWSGFWC